MGKWKRGWKQRIESYWFWFQFFLFSFSVLVTSHKKWIIWQHFFTKRKGMWRNAAICGELENLYFNLKRKKNTLHSTMHASKLSYWALEYKGSMGLTWASSNFSQEEIRRQCWPLLSATPYHFCLGNLKEGLLLTFKQAHLCESGDNFGWEHHQHKPIKPYSSHLATHTIEASSYSVLMTNISHSPVEWCGTCWIVTLKTLEYNHPFLPFFQLLSSPTTEE